MGHHDFLDQESEYPLARRNVKGLSILVQPPEKAGKRFR